MGLDTQESAARGHAARRTVFEQAAASGTCVLDGNATVVGPDASRRRDNIGSFAELVMAPLSEGLWQHSEKELGAWTAEIAAWELSLQVGKLRICAEQVTRRTDVLGLSETRAINRTGDELAARSRIGTGSARSTVVFAVAVSSRPAVLAAIARAEATEAQAKAILRLIASLPEDDPDSIALADQIEAVLLDTARSCRSAQSGAFADAVTKFDAVLNPDGTPPADDPERNEFSVARLLNGRYRVRGDVDAETGEQIHAALSPLSAPRPEDDGTRDRRGAARRRADALAEIIRRYLCGLGPDDQPDSSSGAPAGDAPGTENTDGGSTAGDADESADGAGTTAADEPAERSGGSIDHGRGRPQCEVLPGGNARPQVHVHIRARDLADLPADQDQLLSLLRQGRIHDMFTLLQAGWTGHHGTMSTSVLRRMACDSAVTPILIDGRGTPLDLGRTARLASRAQRRALAARDHGCAFPGCTRPIAWTDAHHIIHWADGGPTDLDNLVLLCTAHHRAVHNDGWDIAMSEHRRPVFRPPSGIDPFRRWIDHEGLTTAEPDGPPDIRGSAP
ncbi:HNH endonuclease signature motif containing protein [Tomitella gaofuii]|uniref:HNH endonuclease signature motif containing protein n=1 Tax=Tomitella gaofuii TaxID=2760083 RepID=UPI0015FE20EE|nr:HNH endonuclease signature motif containing protein [Tomitella gaofuii]